MAMLLPAIAHKVVNGIRSWCLRKNSRLIEKSTHAGYILLVREVRLNWCLSVNSLGILRQFVYSNFDIILNVDLEKREMRVKNIVGLFD